MKLLSHVAELIRRRGYVVENIDATIIAQKPKMRPHIPQMEETSRERSASARIGQCQGDHGGGLGFTGTGGGFPHRRSARFPVFMRKFYCGGLCGGLRGLRRLRTKRTMS